MERTRSPLFPPPSVTEQSRANGVMDRLERSTLYQEYREAFETVTGLPLALRKIGTFQASFRGSRNLAPFCSMMTRSSQSCSACLQCQSRLEQQATESARILRCFAGLHETMIPIKTGERVVGHLHTGQVLFKTPTAAGFRTVVERLKLRGIGVNISELRAAYFAVQFIPRARYDAIVRLLGAFAGHLSFVSADLVLKQNGNEPIAVSKARAYVDQNMSESLALAVVARAVHMSPFYLCKKFKASTGFTLTDYIARSRVSKVKVLLRDPLRRVSEAAYAAGFQSLSQFNRVFRRVEGQCPTRHRELQRDEPIRLEEMTPCAASGRQQRVIGPSFGKTSGRALQVREGLFRPYPPSSQSLTDFAQRA